MGILRMNMSACIHTPQFLEFPRTRREIFFFCTSFITWKNATIVTSVPAGLCKRGWKPCGDEFWQPVTVHHYAPIQYHFSSTNHFLQILVPGTTSFSILSTGGTVAYLSWCFMDSTEAVHPLNASANTESKIPVESTFPMHSSRVFLKSLNFNV